MKPDARKKESVLEKARASLNAHPLLFSFFLCLLVVVVIARNWSTARTYLLRISDSPPAVQKSIHWSIGGEADSFQTMPATHFPESGTMRYAIHGNKGDEIEVGLLRVTEKFLRAPEYVFRIYEFTSNGKKKVLEKSGEFAPDFWAVYQIGENLEWHGDGTTVIEYELKPKGLRNRIASLFAQVKGQPYYKDFTFLTPSVFHRRKPGEFNVILVSFDTLRADRLGCFGYERPTSPNIDSFAVRAALFVNAITPSPWTAPSHRSVFTGLYPSAHSLRHWDRYKDEFIAEETIASLLRDNGYYTLGITGGLTVSYSHGFSTGFRRFIEYRSISNAETPSKSWEHEDGTRKTFEFAMDWLDANHEAKFFMFVHQYECHDPYEDEFFLEAADQGSLIEKRRALYDGDIRRGDAFFGRLVEKLESLDLLSNTAIVFFSDHGEDLHDHYTEDDRLRGRQLNPIPQISSVDHGHSLYEEITRVPLIFHLPGLEPPRGVIENQVSLIDITPTILDYLGLQYDIPVQGVSLVELIRTGEREQDPPAISEFMLYEPEQKSVRTNKSKYIFSEDPTKTNREPTFRNIPRHALFDLRNDPDERENIYESNRKTAEKYHRILEQTIEQSREINKRLQAESRHTKGISAEEQADRIESMKALGYL